ncbi:MAG: hypothetical protein WDA47_01685 [Bacilli bacterium]
MAAAAPLFKILSQVAKKGKAVVSGRTARKAGEEFEDSVLSWIKGETNVKPDASVLYRGVPGHAKEGGQAGEFTHVTPWGHVAARGGKGLFGDPRGHKVYAYPSTKHDLYRGGSLAGDPLESTAIPNMAGADWDSLLDQARVLYQKEFIREKAKARRAGVGDFFTDLELSNIVGKKVMRDLRNASFEADIHNRPGIWKGHSAPRKLSRERPGLRSIDELETTLRERLSQGYSKDDIMMMPEARILNRSGRKDILDSLME